MSITWIAEAGSNHKGVKSLAYEMIRQSAEAGASLVKFQLGHRQHGSPVQQMRYAPMEWAPFLKESCDFFGVEFCASIFSYEGLKLARKVGMKRYKVAYKTARENWALVEEMAKDHKEMFMSGSRVPISNMDKCRTLYCVPEYPTYHYQLPKEFGKQGQFYGLSSHVHGFADSLVAVARGAKVVEKHLTLDKTESSIKDNWFALSPIEFAEMVRVGNTIARTV